MLTWVEIDTGAIKFNLRQFRKMIEKRTLLMPVIKANAYGHGFLEVAGICDKSPQVDRICVVNDDEALSLISHKIRKPVQILTFYETGCFKKTLKLAKKGVIFPLFSLKQAIFLNKVGDKAHKKIKVHIKVDTGASRVGLMTGHVIPFLKKVYKLKWLTVEGIYSHFAASEEDRMFTDHQMRKFHDLIAHIEKAGYNIPLKHFACSSAGILYPITRLDGVRLGLSLYGLYPEESSRKLIHLRPALSWRTKIIQIRTLPPLTKIGYGSSFTTKKITRIAVLPVGYWDGYDRRLSNNSDVIIKGKRCPVRGRICMNIMMVELHKKLRVKTGDTATLIGKSGRDKISTDDIAQRCSTINYEIIDRINPLLPRIIV